MSITAKSILTRERPSFEAAERAAREIQAAFTPALPRVVLCYATVNHDQARFLEGLRSVLGPDVPIVGCSGQGVTGRGAVHEKGYAASLLGLGGEGLEVAVGDARDIGTDTHAKGAALARGLRARVSRPRVTLLHYDPVSAVDVDVLLAGIGSELDAPVIGGAAGHYFDVQVTTTYQYFGAEAFSRGAVAVALGGDFCAEAALSTGCSPVGSRFRVTRADGNMLLELDGRPALDVWQALTVARGSSDLLATASLAIGVPDAAGSEYLVRAAYVFDPTKKGILVGSAIAEGTEVMLYHRTVEDTVGGAVRAAEQLAARLSGKTLRAVLGFECGGRTLPFLGEDATNDENRAVQARLSPGVEWAGLVCWGEIFPSAGKPAFHNYALSLLALAD